MFSQLQNIVKNEIIRPIAKTFNTVIFGSKKTTPIYSTEGLLTPLQFFIILFEIGVFYSIFAYFHNPLLTYIVGLLLFYAFLTIVQKRCRDFGNSGTLWILAISFAFIGNMAFHFFDMEKADDFLWYTNIIAYNIQLIVFLLLILIPSKANIDLNLRSPLLKYPLLYTVICVVLAIAATIIVNHYV